MEESTLKPLRLLLIGGSAGSLEALLKFLPGIDFVPPFAIVIVLHRRPSEDQTLEALLALKAQLPLLEVEDKTPLLPGHLYIAPADYHLLFEKDGTLALDMSAKVNYSRPSIDLAFESAADAYGNGLAGILLSGANADGTEGLKAIVSEGGRALVQDPATAEVPFMPANALRQVKPVAVYDPEGLLAFIREQSLGF